LLAALIALVLGSGGVAAEAAGRHHHRSHRSHRHARHHVKKRRTHRHRHIAHARPVARTKPAPAPPAPKPPVFVLPPATPPATTTPATVSHLQVPEREFSLSLAHAELPAGRAVIEAVNFGEDPHNLRIERVGGDEPATVYAPIAPGTRASQTVALQPGSYVLFCSFADHAALGMKATLTVR
jgi:plastocyanin